MLLKNINHIAIIVSNMDVSKDFYVNKLGFKFSIKLGPQSEASK